MLINFILYLNDLQHCNKTYFSTYWEIKKVEYQYLNTLPILTCFISPKKFPYFNQLISQIFNTSPSNFMPEYGDTEYWEKRYQDDKAKTFDWYSSFLKDTLLIISRLQDYQSLKAIIEQVCTKTSKILMLGCGNARKFSYLDV